MPDALDIARERVLSGRGLSPGEALALAGLPLRQLQEVADEVRAAFHGDGVETCSIANARSGRCSEDCKWCAQSRHFHTGVQEYDILPEEETVAAAVANGRAGVQRFSLVTSGRKVSRKDIDTFCNRFRSIRSATPISMCASMGLLDRESLAALRDAGVTRYHCNLETSRRFFPTLCTTHTTDDKLRTIANARAVGMEVCSGGIIGMGETLLDRLEMAAMARDAGAVSIPVNILSPIPGTALASQPLLSEPEIELSVALMRLVAPKCVLRFAGGRARLSRECTRRLLRGGMNGTMVGDLLTTSGRPMDADRLTIEGAGLHVAPPIASPVKSPAI